jgi:hypothetical protein
MQLKYVKNVLLNSNIMIIIKNNEFSNHFNDNHFDDNHINKK